MSGGQTIPSLQESDETLRRYRTLLATTSRLGRICYWSLNYADAYYETGDDSLEIFGWPEGVCRIPEADFSSRIHPDDLPEVVARRRAAIRDDKPIEMEYRFWHARDGCWIDMRSLVFFIRNPEGKPVTLYGFSQDVTQQKKDEECLRLAASVFEKSRNLILIADSDQRIIQVNPAFRDLTGFTADDAIGRLPHELLRMQPRVAGIPPDFRAPLLRADHWSGDIDCRRKNGESFVLAANITAVRCKSGEMSHIICIGDDVTKQKEAERQINLLAYYDPLTRLPNRVRFKEDVESAMRRAARDGHAVAVLFLDIDYFKNVNDSLGHSAGDQLLIEVAARLRATLRPCDTIGRLGGDEFMILLPFVDSQAARRVAEELVAALSAPFRIDAMALTVTASIGISLFPRDGDSYDALLQASDAAMYRAKGSGRNTCFEFVPEMNELALKRLKLSNGLRHALQRSELSLHYQPQVSLHDGQLIGVEALIRWQHPEWGMVSPAEFIPVAEETGLIGPIGAWVIEEACRQAVAWDRLGLPELTMSVNCSTRQFLQPQALLDTVRSALHRSGLPPSRLELEITESLVVQDVAKTEWLLDQFRALGVRIAIDDFGTGYSSLYYLKRLPIDKLKIDRSFVNDLVKNTDDQSIAAMVGALGHLLNMKVLAEGVETAEQLEILAGIHCDQGQGYLWSRPLPAWKIAGWYGERIRHARQRGGPQSGVPAGNRCAPPVAEPKHPHPHPAGGV